MKGPEQIIVACWVLFVLYWIVSARSVKPAAERLDLPRNLAHRLPVFFGYLMIFYPRLPFPLGVSLTPRSAATEYLGAAICVTGLAGAIWARRTLARNWSSSVQFKVGHELIEKGPYRFVRHPIYTGILLMALGPAIASERLGSWLGLALIFLGFWIKLRQEEILLTRHFPEYAAYKARVKALVPFVF